MAVSPKSMGRANRGTQGTWCHLRIMMEFNSLHCTSSQNFKWLHPTLERLAAFPTDGRT